MQMHTDTLQPLWDQGCSNIPDEEVWGVPTPKGLRLIPNMGDCQNYGPFLGPLN